MLSFHPADFDSATSLVNSCWAAGETSSSVDTKLYNSALGATAAGTTEIESASFCPFHSWGVFWTLKLASRGASEI